jgi:hypothetical protein
MAAIGCLWCALTMAARAATQLSSPMCHCATLLAAGFRPAGVFAEQRRLGADLSRDDLRT